MKNKTTAGLLAMFFGWAGAHRFYLNQTGLGLLYLGAFAFGLFSSTWLFWVLIMIDAIMFFTMGTEEFDKKYNRKELLKKRDDQYIREKSQKRKRKKRPTQAPRQETTRPRPRPKTNRKTKNNPYKESGKKKFADYDYEGAVLDFEKAIQLSPDDIALHFNTACTYSLLENAEKAFYHIDKAVKYGFTDFEKIESHDALAYLRVQDGFDEFKANNFRFNVTTTNTQAQEDIGADSKLLEKLNRLQDLRKKGLLTDAEFAKQKERILNQ